MVNRFVGKIAEQTLRARRVPKRAELLKTVAQNPRSFLKTLGEVDRRAIQAGRAKTGKGRFGQTLDAGRRAARTDTAKDLAVNTGGFVGSAIGGSVGGVGGALIGDNLGAVGTRRLVNRAFARARARTRLGPMAPRQQVANRARRITRAAERLDKRKSANLADQVGWGVGNSVAMATPGVAVPLRGGFVAMRTVPQASRNASAVLKGQKGVRQAIRDTGAEIARDNNLKRIVRRGNARERLMRRRLNKVIDQGYFVRPIYPAANFRQHRPLTHRRWRSRQPGRATVMALG